MCNGKKTTDEINRKTADAIRQIEAFQAALEAVHQFCEQTCDELKWKHTAPDLPNLEKLGNGDYELRHLLAPKKWRTCGVVEIKVRGGKEKDTLEFKIVGYGRGYHKLYSTWATPETVIPEKIAWRQIIIRPGTKAPISGSCIEKIREFLGDSIPPAATPVNTRKSLAEKKKQGKSRS